MGEGELSVGCSGPWLGPTPLLIYPKTKEASRAVFFVVVFFFFDVPERSAQQCLLTVSQTSKEPLDENKHQ